MEPIVADREKAAEEITHLTAKLTCAEEEITGLRVRCGAQGDAYHEEMKRMLEKVAWAEEEVVRREKHIEALLREHREMVIEVGRIHMQLRHVNEILTHCQQENDALKAHIQQAERMSAATSADDSRIMARIVPHDKKGGAEVEGRRKPGM